MMGPSRLIVNSIGGKSEEMCKGLTLPFALSAADMIPRHREVSMSRQGFIVGLFAGGVANLTAPDGRPLTTAIRKSRILGGSLEVGGFRGDASAEPDHHTGDKAVHLFADENYPW
jgi:hypothetical protein